MVLITMQLWDLFATRGTRVRRGWEGGVGGDAPPSQIMWDDVGVLHPNRIV